MDSVFDSRVMALAAPMKAIREIVNRFIFV